MGLFNKDKKLPESVGMLFKEAKKQGPGLVDYGRHKGLAMHKMAEYDEATGEAILDAEGHKVLAGIRLYGPPVEVGLPRSVIERGIREQWATVTEPTTVYLHTGPAENPSQQVDAVTHYKYVTFHTLDGDYTYEITQNPDREDRAYYGRAI